MPIPVEFYFVVFMFGAVFGSFLNVCIYRLPERKSVVFPPSHCPQCNAEIPWYDNIPLLSYISLQGRCRSCKGSISIQYPLVELLTGLLTLFLLRKFGLTPTGVVLLLLCLALVVITFIDLEHQIIPDVISLSGILIGFGCSFLLPWLGWKNSLLGILLGGGILLVVAYGYHFLTGKDGMGGGDIKLLAMLGAFLGWRAIPFIIFAASLIGSIIGVSVMLAKRKDGKLAIPFGPFLALGALLYIFFGKTIIQWYFSLGRGAGG